MSDNSKSVHYAFFVVKNFWSKPTSALRLSLGGRKQFFRENGRLAHTEIIEHNIQTNLTLLDEKWIEILRPLIPPDGFRTFLG